MAELDMTGVVGDGKVVSAPRRRRRSTLYVNIMIRMAIFPLFEISISLI